MKLLVNKFLNNRLINNFIVLLTGEGIVSVIGMLSLAIIVKTIGLEANGMILSIIAYCQLMNNVFGFKSYQALIRYITIYLEKKENNMVKKYIYQSYFLDIAAALLAAISGFIFLEIYASFMDWNNEIVYYCKIFLIAYFSQIQGTPVGVLRAFNKFNFITYNNVIISIIKLIGYLLGFILGLRFKYFIIVEIILIVLPNIILNIFAFNILKKNNLHKFYKEKFKVEKEFFMFNFYSNISSTIDIPVGTLTTIFINKYLGYTDISIYKIFEKIGGMIGKLGAPLNQIIYPELNKYIAKKDYKRAKKINDKLVRYISLLGCFIIIGVYITHKYWLGMFIEDYYKYISSLLFYLIFIVFVNATSSVHSLFMALNYIKYNIPILLIVNSIYLIIMYALINMFRLNGVILSLLLQGAAVIIIKLMIMRKNNYKEKVVEQEIA